MFDVTITQQGLTGLVGIRQPLNPAYQFVDVINQASASGRYLDDLPAFKVEYFKDTQDYSQATDAELNDLLRSTQDGAISTVVQHVFGDGSYIDRNVLYSQANTRQTPESTIKDGFVGFELQPSPKKDLAFEITDVRLEFSGTGTLKLLLFATSENAPIFTQDVTISSTSQVETLDWVINNTTGGYKGKFYFGYIYDGSLIPFKRNYENADFINDLTNLGVQKVFKEGATDVEIFDLENLDGLSENTGLNPDITVYNDYTDLVLQNKRLFAHAIQLQWAVNIMQRYISTTRSNKNERIVKDVLAALGGTNNQNSTVKIVGLRDLLNAELSRLKKTTKELREGYLGGRIRTITQI